MPIPGIPESYQPEFWQALEMGAGPEEAISLARAATMFASPQFGRGAQGGAGFTRPQTGNRGRGGAGSAPGNTPRAGIPEQGNYFRPGPDAGAGGGMATLPFIPGPQVPPDARGGVPPDPGPGRFHGIPREPIPYDFFTEAIPPAQNPLRRPMTRTPAMVP